jgi:uncharacterized protein
MSAASVVRRLGLAIVLSIGIAAEAHADFDEAVATYRAGNSTKAFSEFLALAEKGDRNAQVMAGNMYLEGTGVERDVTKAAQWFQKAATAGHSYAQYALGLLYMTGQGVTKDQARGISWLEKAAQQGSIFADTTLGDAYSNGIGVSVDQARGVGYFRSAAEQNYAPAQLKLASALYLGRGVARDPVEAFKWAYLSALQLGAASSIVEKFRKELPQQQLSQGEAAAKRWLASKGLQAGR